MAKWARVGDIPKKIPVNFVVDSERYPALAAWIYSFGHGEMGKTVRDILNNHVLSSQGKAQAVPTARSDTPASRPAVQQQAVSQPHPAVLPAPADQDPGAGQVSGDGDDHQPPSMDAGTASALMQLDMDS